MKRRQEAWLDLLHDARLQVEGTKAVNLCLDVMASWTGREPNVSDFRSDLQGIGTSLDLHIFDDGHRVPIAQYLAVSIANDIALFSGCIAF